MPDPDGSLRRAWHKVRVATRVPAELGGSTTLAILVESARALRRERSRRATLGRRDTARAPGLFVDARRPDPAAVLCRFVEAEVEVRFLRPDVVRVSWLPDPEPVPYATSPAGRSAAVDLDVEIDEGPAAGSGASGEPGSQALACRVASRRLVVEVGRTGRIDYRRPDGGLLRRELPPLRRGPGRVHRWELRPGEVVAGLGEQASGVDLRGGSYTLWNTDPGGSWRPGSGPLYCGVPVTMGLHPEGDVLAFHENPHRCEVHLDGHGPRSVGPALGELRFEGGMLRHYVVADELPGLLDAYTELTGRPAVPPRWALGYHQCRWGFRSAEEVAEVARRFASEDLPLSAVHLDIDHMDRYRVFTIDRRRFPDLRRLAGALAAAGTRLVTIVDPGVAAVADDASYAAFTEGVAGRRFVLRPDGEPLLGVAWPGRCAYPDFTDPETRSWWGNWCERLLEQDVAGFWHDMNEPTSISLVADPGPPLWGRHRMEGRGGSHAEAHNLYGSLMDRAGWEAQAERRPARRPFVLSRSGWAGVQRWAWLWTADVDSSWEGLHQQVATIVGLGLSGIPFVGCDIGGFNGAPSPELFVRWLELAVLLPLCRTHSVLGVPPREPWCFREPERHRIEELIRLRYRLLPYLYTVAQEAARTGRPMIRPACWPSPGAAGDDGSPGTGARPGWSSTERRALDDRFLLGDAVLAAPVTARGAEAVRVRLPAGRWHAWDPIDDRSEPQAAPAGSLVRVAAPLGHPALLVRAGSVVPLDDAWAEGVEGGDGAGGAEGAQPAGAQDSAGRPQLTDDHAPQRLCFHCWPDEQGHARGTLHDDPGDGPPDGSGPGRWEEIRVEPLAEAAARAGDARGLVVHRRLAGDHPPPRSVGVVLHAWPGLSAVEVRRLGATAEADGRPVPVTVRADGSLAVECPGDFAELRLRPGPAGADDDAGADDE